MRKKHLFKSLTLFVIFVLAFQSCTDDNFVDEQSAIENAEKSLEMTPELERILDMGFDLKDIVETKNSYVVEGDIVFSKDVNKLSSREKTSNFGHTHGNLVSTSNRSIRDIRVFLDFINLPPPDITQEPTLFDIWDSALDIALENWNDASNNNCLRFIKVDNPNNGVDITIYDNNDPNKPSELNTLGDNQLGDALFPGEGSLGVTGNPGYAINIHYEEVASFTSPRLNAEQIRINLLMHEIGHTIGLMHTNRNEGGNNIVSDANIPYTGIDEYSIMNAGTDGFTDYSLSFNDILAYNHLYGSCGTKPNPANPTISGPSEFCVNSGSQSYSLLNITLTPSWQVTPNLTIESSSNTSIIVSPVDTGESSTGEITASFPDGSSATFNVNIIGRSASQNLSTVSGPDLLQHYQSGLFFTNFSDDYDNVEWVIYSNTFQNAIQHFNIQSPAGNNPLNALVEVLPTAPPGNYVVQCRISSECATYYIEKNLTVKRGRPQIFDI